jgi:predicted transcriptional regulator of viral defense system
MQPATHPPDWSILYEVAAGQSGYFTTKQAAAAGFSTHLLHKHMLAGRVTRAQRRIYRLVHFPAAENEELVTAWLWSEQSGVISHQTALSLHNLSDVFPTYVHLTLPAAWRRRRFRVPAGCVLHHADVAPGERTWFGPTPITNASRTLNDCAKSFLSPELLRQAAQQALHRGLVVQNELGAVAIALEPFGGLET